MSRIIETVLSLGVLTIIGILLATVGVLIIIFRGILNYLNKRT